VLCESCRMEMLSQVVGRLTAGDLLVLHHLDQAEATEPQSGRSQVEVHEAMQSRMCFQACRENLHALYRVGLVGRAKVGKKDGYYLTRDGKDILTL
jgi:RIO-like serine/threonine protein kinase